ncbi:hypothetical protein C8R45DRAFT_940621 [Mycena sanguinolenta]|nr:hypothetical protein C8R45DRAFT_940621 [Mycena sanguinolenta]
MFSGRRQSRKVKIVKISGGTGGGGGGGSIRGGSGGLGEGPRVKMTVTNISKKYSTAPAVPSGNIKRLKVARLSNDSPWRYRPAAGIQIDMISGVASRRKLHSARILVDRERLDVTVAVYQGMATGDREIQRSSDAEFDVRIFYCLTALTQLQAARDYLTTTLEHSLNTTECTFFIRRSTGRLCVDLVAGGVSLSQIHNDQLALRQGLDFLARDDREATIIDSLTLDQYHSTCYCDFSVVRVVLISPSTTVNLASMYHCPSDDTFDDVVEIAWLPNIEPAPHPAYGRWSFVTAHEVQFKLTLSTIERTTSGGFLFLSPQEDFQVGPSSFRWPDCPAYWSLDASGAERLTLEDAANLGFPSFVLSTKIQIFSSDARVYAGLRQFHEAKSFHLDSQDVARHLGHPLYQLSGPFAHTRKSFSTEEFPVDFVPASTHRDMEQVPVFSSLEEIVDSTQASALTASSLFSTNCETSAAYEYGYDIQPNQYSLTSDFSNFDPNFDAYNFGGNFLWGDYSAFNNAVPSAASLNYQTPMLHDAAQFFPSTSLPQLPMSFFAPSPFHVAPLFEAPIAAPSLNYRPPTLHDATQFFPATSFPQLPTSFSAASSMIDTPSTTSKKRKTRDETDLANMVQGTRAPKAPKRFDIQV